MILLFYLLTIKDDDFVEQNKASKKYTKILLIIAIISSIACIFVPDKETATEIIIANYITEDNVNTITQNGKEAIDYIFDKIEGLTNENNNENKTESTS